MTRNILSERVALRMGLSAREYEAAQLALPPLFLGSLPPARFSVARNMPKFLAAASPVVLVVGDSTVAAADNVSGSDLMGSLVEEILRTAYPEKSGATFTSLGFGGRSLSDFTTVVSVASTSYPSWYTDHTKTWASYAQALAPDTIVFQFGLNSAGYDNLGIYKAVLNNIAGWAKIPDIVFITNIAGNPSYAPFSTASVQAGFRQNAALARTLSQSGNLLGAAIPAPIGFIDVGRYFDIAVWGVDPVDQIMTRAVLPGSPIVATLPTGANGVYSLPPSDGGDFDATFTITNGSAVDTSMVIALNLNNTGANGYPFINLVSGGGTLYCNVYDGNSAIGGKSIGGWSQTATNTFSVAVRGGFLTVTVNGTIMFRQMIARAYCGFTPTITFSNGMPANSVLSLTAYAAGVRRQFDPLMGVDEAYGVSTNDNYSGNGINHISAKGQALHRQVLKQAFFQA